MQVDNAGRRVNYVVMERCVWPALVCVFVVLPRFQRAFRVFAGAMQAPSWPPSAACSAATCAGARRLYLLILSLRHSKTNQYGNHVTAIRGAASDAVAVLVGFGVSQAQDQ